MLHRAKIVTKVRPSNLGSCMTSFLFIVKGVDGHVLIHWCAVMAFQLGKKIM